LGLNGGHKLNLPPCLQFFVVHLNEFAAKTAFFISALDFLTSSVIISSNRND